MQRPEDFPHRDSTYIRLDPVEVYAGTSCLRQMPIRHSPIMLTLHAANPNAVPDALRGLRDGDCVQARDLDAVIPDLHTVRCWFESATDAEPRHRSIAVTDGVVVTFWLAGHRQPDRAAAEAMTRAAFARLVVTQLSARVRSFVTSDSERPVFRKQEGAVARHPTSDVGNRKSPHCGLQRPPFSTRAFDCDTVAFPLRYLIATRGPWSGVRSDALRS